MGEGEREDVCRVQWGEGEREDVCRVQWGREGGRMYVGYSGGGREGGCM